jgi:acetyl-CoA C-acetyltransferase
MREALIIDGLRSPRGEGKAHGGLHEIHPQQLLAQVLNALRARVGFEVCHVDDVVVGNGSNEGDHSACIGRLSVLAAGWPVEAPGFTVNRYCGSGQQAVALGAMGILAGYQDLVIAGGVESMSRIAFDLKTGSPEGGNDALRDRYRLVPQGIAADLIATLEGFTRDDLDQFAVTSQQRADSAMRAGRFDRSVVAIHHADGSLALDRDEHPRPSTTIDSLAKLRPSFEEMGSKVVDGHDASFDDMARAVYPQAGAIRHVHHARNSSGVVDGAAALILASNDWVRGHGVSARARVVMHAVAGTDPVIMLTAPGPASASCLDKAGMTTADIDLWEINEAFAAVPLKAMRDLRLDPQRINVNGGAIALGHPIGATGVMLFQTALDELERRDLSTALVTMCTGGGMGTATIIERV